MYYFAGCGDAAFYVVDRARVNSTTRYSPEAPAEGLYQVGLFTSALSHLYHGYFLKRTPLIFIYIFITIITLILKWSCRILEYSFRCSFFSCSN